MIIIPTFTDEENKTGELRYLALDHTAGEHWDQDMKPGCVTPEWSPFRPLHSGSVLSAPALQQAVKSRRRSQGDSYF